MKEEVATGHAPSWSRTHPRARGQRRGGLTRRGIILSAGNSRSAASARLFGTPKCINLRAPGSSSPDNSLRSFVIGLCKYIPIFIWSHLCNTSYCGQEDENLGCVRRKMRRLTSTFTHFSSAFFGRAAFFAGGFLAYPSRSVAAGIATGSGWAVTSA